mgnify:FL=1
MKRIILLFCISFIFSQPSPEDWINIYDCSVGNDCTLPATQNIIPVLAANLKPTQQPSWTNNQFMDLVGTLKIQALRWPGAEQSNFFDWHTGKTLPCYKFTQSPCYYNNNCAYWDTNVCSENNLRISSYTFK